MQTYSVKGGNLEKKVIRYIRLFLFPKMYTGLREILESYKF